MLSAMKAHLHGSCIVRSATATSGSRTVSAPTGETAAAPREASTRAARVRATPRARRLAREHDVDLAAVRDRSGVQPLSEKEVQHYIEENRS